MEFRRPRFLQPPLWFALWVDSFVGTVVVVPHTPPGEDLNPKKCTVATTYAKWKFGSKADIWPILEIFWRAIFEKIQKFAQKMKNFKIFFDEHMDTSVIVNDIKKDLEIFHFSAKFLCWIAKIQCDKKYFCCKILDFPKKWDSENLR